jgi:hypothetical protein
MSDHGTDHGTFLTCTPTTRSQRSRQAETYAQNTDHGTDHADHAPSDHALPPLFIGGSVSGDLGRPQNLKETTMSTTTTATIETLTAEVRTLIVGSRQVTLSVAKQLDIIPLSRLRIFGRVHISKDRDYVIGADVDGTLALAKYYPEWRPALSFITADDLKGGHIIVCNHELTPTPRCYRLRFVDETFEVAADATKPCGIDGHRQYGQEKCEGWRTNGCDVLISVSLQLQQDLNTIKRARIKAAAESPLIVLAGLK